MAQGPPEHPTGGRRDAASVGGFGRPVGTTARSGLDPFVGRLDAPSASEPVQGAEDARARLRSVALRDRLLLERAAAAADLVQEVVRRHGSWVERARGLLSPRRRRRAEAELLLAASPHEYYARRHLLRRSVFDPDWYRETNPDVPSSEAKAWKHFVEHGLVEGRAPNPFFEPAWYLKRYPDVERARQNALLHYLFFGALEGRHPGPSFDALRYVEEHPEAAANPLLHHLEVGRTEGWATHPPPDIPVDPPSPERDRQEDLLREVFDPSWYADRNADAGSDPWSHFLERGLGEDRAPNPFFDPGWYASRYPDVVESGQVPLLHYVLYGAPEGRDPSASFDAAAYSEAHPDALGNPLAYHLRVGREQGFSTSPPLAPGSLQAALRSQTNQHRLRQLFDAGWYLERHPDIAATGADPWMHFLHHGLAEGRAPNAFFDPAWYEERYADVAESGQDPLLHYVLFGVPEGRDPNPSFQVAYYVEEHPEAAANPLLFHLEVGRHEGWRTGRIVDPGAYLASTAPAFAVPDLRVDIVIPVYRGLDDTRRCLETVLADRSRMAGRIIVIDDRSPEPELSRYLSERAEAGEITLLRNDENLGFVASVNRGMEAARPHDVVLLNSDTEVPEGWLRRLAAQAHSAPDVGTVTPFSNNATICSYPGLPGGPLPEGRSLRALDAAFARANRGRHVDLPTAVGFAMYIRRDCLDDVGPFDVETFGLGYGEENDFCLRATAKGWRHRLACDTFVYHEGEVSFGAKSEKRDRAWDILVERYPEYPRLVARHVQTDAAALPRFAATSALVAASGKAVILLVLHGLGGGTQRHIHDLVAATRDRAEYLLLQPALHGVSLSFLTVADLAPVVFDADRIDDLVAVLREVRVERVHVHHVLGFRIDLRGLIRALDVPFDFTAHDYFAVCPQINLVSSLTGTYCGEPDASGCGACIARSVAADATDIVSWRWSHRWLLAEADRVLCPTRDVERRLTRYGLQRGVFAPHEPVSGGTWPVAVRPLAPGESLRIAVIGVLAAHKGAPAVLGCASAVPSGEMEFVLVGETKPAIRFPEGAPFRETGPYDEADLSGLIEAVAPHLVWFPAPWPETYSYTLSAAIASGVPIVAAGIGTFPERLAGHPWTWLVPPDADTARWLDAFRTARAAILAGEAPGAERPRAEAEDFYATGYLISPAARTSPSERPQPVDLRRPGRIAVLVVPERLDGGALSPCAFIRALLPIERAAPDAHLDLTLATAAECLGYKADTVFCHRYSPGPPAEAEALLRHCRAEGMRVIYDLDDDLLDVSDEHPEAARLRERSGVVQRYVTEADVVFASTLPLKASLERYRPDVLLVENGIDDAVVARRAVEADPDTDPLRILYMGTATHDADFAFVEPAMRRLHETYGSRVAVDLIGVTNAATLPENVTRMAVPTTARRSYPAFLRWLTAQGVWDIGIAPLTDTRFNHAKSAIKAMDYMASGAIPVVSDGPAYAGLPEAAVVRVENSAEAWFEALASLIDDPERRRRLRRCGRYYLDDRFTLSAQSGARAAIWRQALAPVRPGRAGVSGRPHRAEDAGRGTGGS